MASNLEELARDKGLKGNAFKSIRETLMDQAAKIRVLGGPEHLPVEPVTTQSTAVAEQTPCVELDLDAEWQRQAQNFVSLGFHKERGFEDTDEGKQVYLDTLAKFKPQPEGYKGRVDKPMLIDYAIPWERQRELSGIQLSDYFVLHLDQAHPWEDNHSMVPDGVTSYTGWFNKWGEGDFKDAIGPFSARKKLAKDLTGGIMHEAVAQQIHFPEDNANAQYYDIIGIRVVSGFVACLRRWGDRPRFSASWVDGADPNFRPLVRGSEIETK